MRVVVDNSVLVYLIDPNAPAPIDPSTGSPVQHCVERIEGLLDDLEKNDIEVIIPAPVISELLIKAIGRESSVLHSITARRAVLPAPFDLMAAIENASLRRTKQARSGATKKEVSFDLQILAIARTHEATLVLTDDLNLRARAIAAGIEVKGIAEIAVPHSKMQRPLPLNESCEHSKHDIADLDVVAPDIAQIKNFAEQTTPATGLQTESSKIE